MCFDLGYSCSLWLNNNPWHVVLETLRGSGPVRFDTEVRRALLRRGSVEAGGCQGAAFAGLVESVELLGIQRGLPWWSA